MANFRDPTVILQDFLVSVKFRHALAGLYIWEFVTTLDYEWGIIRGHRQYRWTIVIYSITRVAALLDVTLCLVNMNVTERFNCQVDVTFEYVFGYTAFAAASFLIVLRNIAIWKGNKLAMAMATGVWVTNVGFLIHSVVQIHSARVPATGKCAINTLSTKFNTITTFTTDIMLLLIMLIGLLRLRFHKSDSSVFGLGHLVWRQGLVWLFLATITCVPAVVFVSLNLNDPLNTIFQLPPLISMSIASTRMYRSLMDFSLKSTEIAFITDRLLPIDITSSETPAQSVSLEPVEVVEHKTSEQYQTTWSSQHTSSINGEGSRPDKLAKLGLECDVERGSESAV